MEYVSEEEFDLRAQQAHMRTLLLPRAKKIGMEYVGYLICLAPKRYTFSCGVLRISRGDALRDAIRAADDWAQVNQFPSR